MTGKRYDGAWYDIDPEIYEWSVAFFRTIRKLLKVNIKLHATDQVQQGDIFLFNHFSRFETFIPQYLIYEESGAYSCAIASGEFFEEDTALSRYLARVGVIPHDHPRVFPIVAEQILRGRKIIIFPEGEMVKDRRVLDRQGDYSIYSRTTGERRKQHTGPAVLAQGIEAFKTSVRQAYCSKDQAQLMRWKDDLKLDNLDQLLIAALKPTLIIPSNITFYPIRSSDNLLHQGAEFFSDALTQRQIEELIIEGNILLKDTDMDVRMGQPMYPYHLRHWWNRFLLAPTVSGFNNLDEVFDFYGSGESIKRKLFRHYFKKNADITRNEYMEEMYRNVTINLSHLASTLIMQCIGTGQRQIAKHCFYTTIYIAIKRLQRNKAILWHRSLLNPEDYDNLLHGKGKRFENFIRMAETAGLLTQDEDTYYFLQKLCDDYDIDTVRRENLIAVYYNEAAPINEIHSVITEALKECDHVSKQQLARWYFEDQCLILQCARSYYSQPRFDEINQRETANADPTPFLFEPARSNGVGILLIHGLLASPAELRQYGEYLTQQGYTVLGVRLKGHGTSPHDLQKQSFEDWYSSVEKGYSIISALCENIFVIGFSTGGALALVLAASHKPAIIAVVAVAVPIKFKNAAFMLIPLLEGSNKLLSWVPSFEGVKPFIDNTSEHPQINYRNVSVRSLFELRRLIGKLQDSADQITQPVLILHADKDPIVSIESSSTLMDAIGGNNRQLQVIPAAHHGILMDNTGGTWQIIDKFLNNNLPGHRRS
ncbi:MAG TPA: alpha/beta fold hydrolase [Methylococcaceae bacterium]|jgi:esterase/lipase|nr:alpha/beta fold hydrolase [Methylococcaceae bacterium]